MILVAGIGNIFLGDDAFGCEVVRELSGRQLPENIVVRDFGIRGLDLAYELLKPYDAVIIIDAASGGDVPGTIYVIDPGTGDSSGSASAGGFHETNPMCALERAREMGAELMNVRIVGCEPETLGVPEEGQMGLSACVRASVREAATVIESLIQEACI